MNEVVLRYGNTDLNIHDGYDLAKSSQEVTYSDLTCEFTEHSAEELPERYQEAKIIEKQKVNQEVETIQYEEKNKIKESTFDSEINENLVVDKVYGSTSQETREESKSVLTGSEIVVNDTYIDNKTQFIIDGNSEQETTEGKNKFNLNYIEQSAAKVVTDTGVNLTNCWGTQVFNNEKVLKTFKPNTTYTMKAKAKVVSRPSTQGSHQSATFLLYREGSSPLGLVAVDLIKMKDKETIALNIEKEYVTTFTTPTDLSEVRLLAYSFYGNNDGSTTYAPSGEIDLTDIMLVEGTYTIDNFPSYEPYTGEMPSPSPEYPQKIEVIEGYNLFDNNKVTSMVKLSYSNGIYIANDEDTKENLQYKIQQYDSSDKFISDTQVILNIDSTGIYYFTSKKKDGATRLRIANNGAKNEFTLKYPLDNIKVGEDFTVSMNIIDITVGSSKFKDVMLVKGSTIKPYLPYKNIGLEQSGKNIFDGEFELGIYNGITGEKYPNSDYIRCKNFIPVEELTNYKFSTDSNAFSVVCVYEYKRDFSYNLTSNKVIALTEYLTTNKDTKYITFRLGNKFTDTTIKVQIEEGTIATPYEPYHEKIIPIDLQGNTLAKVGNVKDILKVNRNGEVKIEKNIWEETINSSDLITLSNNNKELVFTPSKKKITSMSDNDYLVTNAQRNRTFNDGTVYQNPSNFVFVGSPTDTLETIKAKFNGGKILYQLATPQTITLPSISPIELEQGTNIFKLISNLDTTIELTYNYISAMPSTETPSKINNTESINIKIQNESLFDIKELVKMSSSFSKVENGYTFKAHSDMFHIGVDLEMPISLPISISYNVKNGTGTNFRLKFWFDDGSTQVLTDYKSGTDTKEHAIVINNFTRRGATKITKIGFDWSTVGTFTITNFMINEGTTTKPYIKHKEQNIPFSLDKPLYQNCYLAEDGIHYKKIQIELDGTTNGLKVTNVTKHSNDIYYCVVPTAKKGINGVNNLYCSHFKAAFGVEIGQCYVIGAGSGIVFILNDQTITTPKAANDWLAEQKEAGNPVTIEYELATEEIVPYTENQKRSWKNLQKLISYTGKNYVESTTDIDIKCPTKIKKEIIPKIYEKLLFTGYVDDYSFNEMREKDVDIDINITLYSPMKMTTLRTATAVGTYELKSLIQKEILSPLIDDGFSIEELDITNRQLTVNYISETIEYCMNNLSNKFNFWWFIDEQKRIYIKDIDKLMGNEANYIYDDTHSIAGLQYIKPITESDNYANVVNFKNVRIYEYSRLQLNGNTITQEHNPLISQQITTIKNGEQLDFNFPCDIKKENIIKSAESNGITQYFYGIYVKGTYSDNTTFEFSIGYDDINKTFETTDNVGFDGSENATEEFLLIRDSFFSNLITGFKLNNENKSIKSIEKITSDSALIWNVNKLYNDKAIADKREIISKTGIVETTIDMNESWKTIQELREIGVSYMNKNSLDLNGTIELCTDRNVFEVGKTIYINKMLVNGTYIITQIKESVSNNDVDYYITAKNANMLDNYIDVFRGEASQESSDKTYQVYITHYEEENMYERHEVVQ